MDEIKPALSREEWAEGRKVVALPNGTSYERHMAGVTADGDVFVYDPDVVESSVIAPGLRHAAAALCLHGQPYGFTREDADSLRRVADQMLEHAGEWYEWAHGLADRIAALLPEEEP